MRFLPVACVISIASLLPASTLTPAPPIEPASFPVPSEGLTIPAREPSGWNLDQLLREYGRVTDQHFMIDEDVRTVLTHTRVSLDAELEVGPEALHSVVESIFVQAGYFFMTARAASPRLITVSASNDMSRALTSGKVRYLSEEELDNWGDHPAYIVQTVLTLDSLDVRTLTNSLRALLTDANVQQIIPVGNSNALLIKGPCPQVESLARLLREMNELERARNAATSKVTPVQTD